MVGPWSSLETQDSRVSNFSFEQLGPDRLPLGWLPKKLEKSSDAWRVLSDKKKVYRGNRSLRIEILRVPMVVEVDGGLVDVEGAAVYGLSGWVQVQFSDSLVNNGRAFLRLNWFTKNMEPLSIVPEETTWVRRSEEWVEVAGTFLAPEDAHYALVGCVVALFSDKAGNHSVWFDEISLKKLPGEPPSRITLVANPNVISLNGPYRAKLWATVWDNWDRPIADGTVVTFETNRGKIESWSRTQNGVATVVIQFEKKDIGGGQISAKAVGVEDMVSIGDTRAARLKGRIFDYETGQPLAAVVRVLMDNGSVLNQKYTKDPGFFADGTFEVLVPPGRLEVSTHRGFEYSPPEPQIFELDSGDVEEVLLPYRRWVDMAALGWYGGDPFIPLYRNDRIFRTDISDIALAARVQGLHYALVTYHGGTDKRIDPSSYLNAEVGRVTTKIFQMGWNLAWPDGVWGRQWFMNVQNTVGLEGEMPGFEAHARIHDRQGIVSYTRLFQPKEIAGGLIFDTLAGPTYDAIDLMSSDSNEIDTRRVWYMLLNQGYRIAGTASSGATLDVPNTWMPGRFRVYTQVEGEVTLGKLSRAIGEGRNFVTSGPLINFSVYAAGPGSVLSSGGRRRVMISAWASADPEEYLTRVELIRNGEVFKKWNVEDNQRTFQVVAALQDTSDCWYISSCFGSDSTQLAVTNPIYFQREGISPQGPVLAIVRGTIQDQEREVGLNAKVEVLDPLGKVSFETVALGGEFQLWISPTSRIRVSHAGYESKTQSVFLDSEIADLILDVCKGNSRALYTWDTYEEVIQKLKQITLNFQLNRQL